MRLEPFLRVRRVERQEWAMTPQLIILLWPHEEARVHGCVCWDYPRSPKQASYRDSWASICDAGAEAIRNTLEAA